MINKDELEDILYWLEMMKQSIYELDESEKAKQYKNIQKLTNKIKEEINNFRD